MMPLEQALSYLKVFNCKVPAVIEKKELRRSDIYSEKHSKKWWALEDLNL